ncbi:MAG: BON domain-containing protein [Acidobacteria bacterium]|nr:BON domain-containing protein [Acidobacteriota bacterium]
MKVRDVMTSNVRYCEPTTNLAAAVAMMWEQNCGVLPTINDQGRVIGVITDRDICMAAATRSKLASEITVGDVISGNVYACSPGDDAEAALATMQLHQVRRLPVIGDDGSLQGILSLDDVVLHAKKTKGKTPPGISYGKAMDTLKAICVHRGTASTEQIQLSQQSREQLSGQTSEQPTEQMLQADRERSRVFRLKSDAQLKHEVLEELKWDTRVDETTIRVEVTDGMVTLAGTAPTYAAFRAAQTAAHRVAGVLDVVNDIQVKVPRTIARSDTDLAMAVRQALAWDVLVPEERIATTVSRGLITLEGTVDSLREREEAGQAVQRLSGVRGVRNKITVKPPKANRGDVRKAIEEALQRCAEYEAEHITVRVTNGKVTLTGRVGSGFEKRAIIETVSHAPGVKIIDDQLQIRAQREIVGTRAGKFRSRSGRSEASASR